METLAATLNPERLSSAPTEKFDVSELDKIVSLMNTTTGETQKTASDTLARFKESPDSWTKVDAILEFSSLPETKYFGLQILEQLIQTRWKALPREQCDGIKGYIVNMILDISADAEKSERNKLLLQKLNLVLVQIVKHEWPRLWPSFISDIVGSSRNSQSLCMNNMAILRLLSEEVFDYGTGLTSARAAQLKRQFCGQFESVFQLCHEILENSDNAQLIYATLQTMHKFFDWVPVGYVFENNMVDLITTKFLPYPVFRSIAVQCLIEISAISVEASPQYGEKLVFLLLKTMTVIAEQVPLDVELARSYANGTHEEQKFVSNLAQLLATFLKEHSKLVEVLSATPSPSEAEIKQAHRLALRYLLKISEVEDVEVFKICLDYWNWLTLELFRESPFENSPSKHFGQQALLVTESLGRLCQKPAIRKDLYVDVLSDLRSLMISRMAKPEEVIVVVNENNEAVRELVKDTDSMVLYKTMRETLVLLTHLDYRDTELKMTEKLQNQVNGTEWSWKNLNTLCWAIGSISGAMQEEDEKRFLVTVIRDLLGLCEQKRGKDNKAVIASNIMYVVGQYPRFLRAHWKFLKTVINKLFEFMHESHEGVQDMACDTFIKIVMKCRPHFVMVQCGESTPFINEILQGLESIICDLSQPQVHVFYEAVGHIIYCQTDRQIQGKLIEKLMTLPNSFWQEMIDHAAKNVELLSDSEVLRNIAHILKTNVAACKSVGAPFFSQLQKILNDMLSVYQVISGNLSKAVNEHGEAVLKQPLIKTMRIVKKEILTLLSTWISRAFEGRPDQQVVTVASVIEHVIQPLFTTVLRDYEMNVPAAREPKVLSLLSITVVSLKGSAAPLIPTMLDAVFTCTLEMINKDMEAYPEHRINFFQLMSAINQHCFEVLISLPDETLSLVIQAVVWAFKHSMRNVAELGIEILKELLVRVATMLNKAAAQTFYQKHFMSILEHVLGVVTDHNQVPFIGLTNLSEAICLLFQAAESSIEVPLNTTNTAQPNMEFVYEAIAALFRSHFSKNLTDAQIRVTIKGFFSFNRQLSKMRDHVRDFLVQIKEEAGEDTADLFLEEKEAEIQKVQSEKRAIPGIQNPNDIDEEE